MIYDIPLPEISPAFTIEDIHKIREWNYERCRDATTAEIVDDIRRGAGEFWERLTQPIDPAIEAKVDRRLLSVSKTPEHWRF